MRWIKLRKLSASAVESEEAFGSGGNREQRHVDMTAPSIHRAYITKGAMAGKQMNDGVIQANSIDHCP